MAKDLELEKSSPEDEETKDSLKNGAEKSEGKTAEKSEGKTAEKSGGKSAEKSGKSDKPSAKKSAGGKDKKSEGGKDKKSEDGKDKKSAKGKKPKRSIVKYFKDAKSEFKKVVWPTPKETTRNTVVVIVVCLLAGLLVFGLDSLFGLLNNLLFK